MQKRSVCDAVDSTFENTMGAGMYSECSLLDASLRASNARIVTAQLSDHVFNEVNILYVYI